jgi:NAD(P)-dependent dehydrogenase (short-subunit alcohol dehydrogenase family)
MDLFSLQDRVALITGGAGLLGIEHAKAIRDAGGVPIITDINQKSVDKAVSEVGGACEGLTLNVTDKASIESALCEVLERHGKLDVLVNNAARNPKVEPAPASGQHGPPSVVGNLTVFPRFANLDLCDWNLDIAVGLTGTMLCCQVFGEHMARNGGGAVVNIGSEYALVAPDQSVYRMEGLPDDQQPSKPLTYTVIKHAIVGLTRHLAVYWAQQGVRVNCLCPGGVEQNQNIEFKRRMKRLIPMGRMAPPDHIHGALVFLCSNASAFMTGEVVAVNGGRTVW